jgi:hypothetical protein
MDEELKQVVKGFPYRVKSFTVYDVNGYRFHTRSHELSQPNRKTMNTGVRTPGTVTPSVLYCNVFAKTLH